MSQTELHHQRGFTLIEMMITVVIIGIAIGTATAMLRFSPEKMLDQETQRLWQLFSLVQEKSRTQGQVLGWQLKDNQYRFMAFDVTNRRWLDVVESPLQPRELNEQLSVQLLLENAKKTSDSSAEKLQPDVLFFPNGESTPFKLILNWREKSIDNDRLAWLENDGISGVYLSTVENRFHD